MVHFFEEFRFGGCRLLARFGPSSALSVVLAAGSTQAATDAEPAGPPDAPRAAAPTGEEAAAVDERDEEGGLSTSASKASAVEEISGPSGIRVILEPAPGAPEVSVCMSVAAGANQDPEGAPGAHRMLAEVLVPGGYAAGPETPDVVGSRGGKSEAFVRRDLTSFCTTAPATELPLALWVTGGRFTRFGLTEEAREAALEHLAELSDRTDEDVFLGRAPTRLRQMAFLGSPAYAHPDLPNSTDLDRVDLALLKELHQASFVAARSVVSISGGFDPAIAKRLIKEHLAPVRPGRAMKVAPPELVGQTTERFSMAEDASSKTPAVWYAWVVPDAEKAFPLEIALQAAVGPSRLGQRLVGPGRAAKELVLLSEETTGPRLLRLRALGTSSRSLGTIEKLIETELTSLSTRDLSDRELSAALESHRQKQAEGLATASGRALALSEGRLRGSAPREVLAPLQEELPSLTAEDVRSAVRTYLVAERRSAVEVYPKGWQDPWQTPMPTYHIVSAGETLTSIALQHGTNVATVTKMNGISSKKPIFPGDKLRVPRGRSKAVKLRTHTVRRGDTLSGLSVKYGVSARGIADLNGMSLKQPIRTGQTLTIPASSGKSKSRPKSSSGASTSGGKTHQVSSGETLGGIAIKYGVRLSALATANGLTTKSMVRVGQTLVIPTGEAALRPGAVTYLNYTVKSGDTLSGIAKRHGVTVTEIERANGFNRKRTLKVGQGIKIPQKK